MPGTGFDRARDLQRSRQAAVGYHHEAALWGLGRIRWTVGNILRLIALIAVVAAALTGVTLWGFSTGRDSAASGAVARQYFDAVDRSDEAAMEELSCPRDNTLSEEFGLSDLWGFDDFTAAMDDTSGTEMEVRIGLQYGDGSERFHDFEIARRVRGTVMLTPSEGPRPWLVCGFLDIEVWEPI